MGITVIAATSVSSLLSHGEEEEEEEMVRSADGEVVGGRPERKHACTT